MRATQVVEVVAGDVPKDQWLMGHIHEFIDRGDVLVFANQKTRVDMLCDKLKAAGVRYACLSLCVCILHSIGAPPCVCSKLPPGCNLLKV